MGKITQSAINVTLTTYAQGVAQDLTSAIANFIAPIVRVGSPVGQFKKFNEKDAFQIYQTGRGYGGAANRIAFGATDGTLNCLPQALEIAIDDAERSPGADPVQMEQAKVRTLISATTISHEKKVLDLIKSGKAATGGIGNWTAADADPVAEIDAMIESIATKTGMMPNRILFGLGALRIIRNNPKVLAKFPGAAQVGVTMDQLLGLFLNPQMQGKVAVLSGDTTKTGATANIQKHRRASARRMQEKKAMKKTNMFLATVLILCAIAVGAQAGTPFTKPVTITSTGSYTNSRDYAAEKILNIDVFNSTAASDTVTVTRVRSSRTNTVAVIVVTSGAGSWSNTNSVQRWNFKGDVYNFSSTAGSNSVAEITGETN
jgi:hypothetical protein